MGYLEEALALDPENPAIIDSMGWVLFNLGDYDAALDLLEQAFELYPDPEVAAHIIDTQLALGNREMALDMLREQLEEHPDSPHLQELDQRRDLFVAYEMLWWVESGGLPRCLQGLPQLRQLMSVYILEEDLLGGLSADEVKADLDYLALLEKDEGLREAERRFQHVLRLLRESHRE